MEFKYQYMETSSPDTEINPSDTETNSPDIEINNFVYGDKPLDTETMQLPGYVDQRPGYETSNPDCEDQHCRL